MNKLCVPISLRHIASCRTSLTTPAIKNNFLFEQRFLKTVSFFEFLMMSMKCVAKDGEGKIHSGRNHALHSFVRFPNVDEI